MKYKCLRWDYLNNVYDRIKKNIDYLEALPEDDDARDKLVENKIELLEVEDAMNRLRKHEKETEHGKE